MKWFAMLATTIQCVVFIGLARFVALISKTFEEIVASGTSDPKVMAQGLGEAMVPVVLAVSVSVFGILGSVLITVASSYRAAWFYWCSVVLAVVHVLALPFGTVFGLAFLVLLVVKRAEFRSAKKRHAAAST